MTGRPDVRPDAELDYLRAKARWKLERQRRRQAEDAQTLVLRIALYLKPAVQACVTRRVAPFAPDPRAPPSVKRNAPSVPVKLKGYFA